MATLTTTISYGEPTGSLVATIGTPGPQGIPGPQGPQGPQGDTGSAATIAVGTVTTVPTGNPATVTNVGSTSAAVFNFGLPQGVQGNTGSPGAKGDKGDQGIQGPKGDTGSQGAKGDKGDQGDPGPAGVVAATAPILYDSGTQTVSINLNPTEFGSFTLTDSPNVAYLDAGLFRMSGTAGHTDYLSTGITFPDATTQSTAATPFNGGAVANPITMSDGGNDSEMSAAFFGVELSSDTTQYAELQYNSLTIGNAGSHMQVTPAGITFPDSSVQTKAAFVSGSGDLDMMGYSITNANFNSSAGQVSAQNVTLSSGGSITFGDSTVQTTAYTGGGGGGLPVVQIAASAINPGNLTFSPSPQCVALTYPTHTDVLNGTYATAITYSNDSVGNPALILSGLTALTTAIVSSNALMTSAPSFSGCTSLYTASVVSNASMTSAPDFSGCTSLYIAQVYSNASMTSVPSFSGLTALNTANVYDNALMTSAPDFSGLTALYSANVYGNASMTSAPSFSGCTALYSANVYDNSSMTSAPSFSGLTALYAAQVSGNTSMTSAPDFSGLTALTNAQVYGNASMTSTPSFSGCTALNTANVSSNTSMTSAPDFSGLTALTNAQVYGNASMTSTPSFSGCTALNTANVYNNALMTSAPDFTTITQSGIQINLNSCAISDCTTPLDQLDAGGGSSGFIDLSGGTNQSIDPAYVSLTNLQSKGWTIVFNSL